MDIIIELRQPWFSASQKFGWTDGVWGIGVDMSLIRKAIEQKRKLRVKYKDQRYQISGKSALRQVEKYHSYYQAGSVLLGVIPKDKFKKLPSEEKVSLADNISPHFNQRIQELRKLHNI